MGVHSLWKILEPSSKAVRLESLSKKKLAIDASIWIYQFLKAMRDKSGNSLNKSHILGFFRRICKLIYFGILPVFVFDGGVPLLKRQTISKRKEARQGRKEDAEKTARKLLAIQLQRQSSMTESPPKKDHEYKYMDKSNGGVEAPKFKSSDEFDLPVIKGFHHKRNDERINAEDNVIDTSELTHPKDELDGIDLNTIDPSSKEFDNLPLTTQYMILSQLRLRSRLRMGYSKEQLDEIFPNSLDFSKFQIKMVQKRNYFTQKLMGMNGMEMNDDEDAHVRRVAGEKGKAYKISKNEGGWSLSLNDDDSGTSALNPIDVDKEHKPKSNNPFGKKKVDEDDDSDIEWEDVSLESKEKTKVGYSIGTFPLPSISMALASSHKGAGSKSFTFSPQKKVQSQRYINDSEDDEEEDLEQETLEQMEQIELMQAIEKSKKDLQNELNLERKILNDATKRVHEEEKEDHQEEEEEPLDLFEDIPLETKTIKIPFKSTETNPPPPPPPKFTIPTTKSTIPSESAKLRSEMDHLLHMDNEAVTHTTIKESEISTPIHEVKEQPAKTPSWFNSNFDIDMSKSLLSSRKKQQSFDDTRQENVLNHVSGLVPWFEAKQILEEKEEVMREKNDDDDVVEVVQNEDDNDVVEVVVDGLSSETEKNNDDFAVEPVIEKTVTSSEVQDGKEDSDKAVIMNYEFYESDEEELENQLIEEEKEHEEFTKNLNSHVTNNKTKNFDSVNFERERSRLVKQQAKDKRDSDEVTTEMIREVQELLSYFGIPYITAPMEAEAQCAELLNLGLVDGIITDDSDVFLFGGDKVYKNMFHEKNYVEFYNGENLMRDLGLDREKLINLAHLLGSDYTEGLKGIGPVNAIEILANFDGDLKKFRNWFMEGQFDLNKQKNETTFMKNLRKKLVKNNVDIDEQFPNLNVNQAYLKPEVDSDKTQFQWGKPDLDIIREYLNVKIGWSLDRINEVLLPLIQSLNKRERDGLQSTLSEVYDVDEIKSYRKGHRANKRIMDATGKIKSKRVKR